MARARNIKPGFFENEDLPEVPPMGRLLFIGLWLLADREGRLEYRPKRIKAKLFPYEECDVDSYCCQLEQLNFLKRYEISGTQYIQIVKFKEHQKPHPNEKASEIPPPTGVISGREKVESTQADSLNDDSLNEEVGGTESKIPPCPYEEIVEAYHRHLPTLPKVMKLTPARKKAVQARWREEPAHREEGFWDDFFRHAASQPFLLGDNPRKWTADFEWLMKQANFWKVVEGKYEEAA